MANDLKPPRLLQISQKFAACPISGAELRIYHLATRLARYMSVRHLGFASSRAPNPPIPRGSQVEFVPVPRDQSYVKADLLRGVLGRTPFSVLNYTRQSMKDALAQCLEKERFDIVLLESVHLGGYLQVLRNARNRPRAIACDWHNIESELLLRYGDTSASLWRRLYARRSAHQLEAYERWFVNQCDLHIVVSDRDRDALLRHGSRAPVVVIDNGVDVERFSDPAAESAETARPRRFRVLFVGSMDYHANIEAVLTFAREAWPRIRRNLPTAVFTVVGRNPAPEVKELTALEGVEVTGTVSDVLPYYREAFASVAPIRVAGGTRIKILESMAAGVPVVSTSRGAEGLEAAPGSHYIRAETSAEMGQAIAGLMADPAGAQRLSTAARALVQRRYDWSRLGDDLAARLLALIQSPPAASGDGA